MPDLPSLEEKRK